MKGEDFDRTLFNLDFLTYQTNKKFIKGKKSMTPFDRVSYRGGRLPPSARKSVRVEKEALITQGQVTDL